MGENDEGSELILNLQSNNEFQKWVDEDQSHEHIANYILKSLERFGDEAYNLRKCYIRETLFPFKGIFYGVHVIPTKERLFDARGTEHAVIFIVD